MDIARTLSRVRRIPARVARDVLAVRTLRNWSEFLLAELRTESLPSIHTRDGVTLYQPHGANLRFLFSEIWLCRVYTPPGYQVRPGDLVIDIGANIGVFAAYAASSAAATRVLAYEPFPDSATALRSNIAASRLTNVQVFEQAVAAARGRRQLSVGTGNWLMNSLVPAARDAAAPTAHHSSADFAEVECVGLDDVFSENEVARCDLLKIDCEGSEYEILRACSPATWEKIERVVIEYHEGPHIRGTGAELRDLLVEQGFRIDRFEAAAPGTGYLCARASRLPSI